MEQRQLYFGFMTDHGIRTVMSEEGYEVLREARAQHGSPVDWTSVLGEVTLPRWSVATFIPGSVTPDQVPVQVTGTYGDMRVLLEHTNYVVGENHVGPLYLPLLPLMQAHDDAFVVSDQAVAEFFDLEPDDLPIVSRRAA